jgi:hypothetical protein
MTANTNGDQVLHVVMAELASSLLVVNLQVVDGPAIPAAPSVTVQHLSVQLSIGLGL